MNNNIKRSFAVRTIIAMVIIFVAAVLTATSISAQKYIDDAHAAIEQQVELLKAELNECRDINKESTEYRDGLNVAQAYSVMRYYRFTKLPDLKEQGMIADAALYHVTKDEQGYDKSYELAMPETTVIFDNPFSVRSSIIVLDDAFDVKQKAQIEKVIEKGKVHKYIENAEGYKEGRFFYPTKLPLGTYDGEEVVIEADQSGHSGSTVKEDLQDIQIVRADGTVTGGHKREPIEPTEYRSERERDYDRNMKEEEDWDWISEDSMLASYETYTLGGLQLEASRMLHGTNYVIKLYAEAEPFVYVMKSLTDFYIALAILLIIIGRLLISTHSNVIDRRMETEKKRRHMMDSMAHEMKTPLSVIKGYGEILLEENDEEKRERFTKNIIEEANDMNRIIVSMLDYSKMEEGTYPMELSSISVSRTAEIQMKKSEVLMAEKNLQLEADLQDVPMILADEKLVNSIISNFLSNAVHHAQHGGKIKVSVNMDKNDVYIGVYNQGQHVSAQEMDKLWNSFYRSRSINNDSTGLGLAIVRNACLMHNGSYGCSNEDDGVTFWAKIQSMDENIRMKENMMGPVLGVTGETYGLTGLVTAAVGTVLMGLPMQGLMTACMQQLGWRMFDMSNMYWYSGVSWMMIIGAIFICHGLWDLYKKKIFGRRILVLGGIFAATVLMIQILSGDITQMRKFICIFVAIFTAAVLVCVITVAMFSAAIRVAGIFDEWEHVRKFRHRRMVYLILYVLCMAVSGVSWIYEGTGVWSTYIVVICNIASVVVPVYILSTMFRVWKRYNGRPKVG